MVSVQANGQWPGNNRRLQMDSTKQPEDAGPKRKLTPEAQRALAEAEERRRLADARRAAGPQPPKEVDGREGPDPTRYGDWEKGGIVSDF
jgi:hypothetical protein